VTDPIVTPQPAAEPDSEASDPPARKHHDLYGQSYYDTHLWLADGHGSGSGSVPYRWGEPYWEEFYRHIAGEIVLRLHPQTVLDAGCAIGFLVKSFRDLDVDAVGFDASAWAISQVLDEARSFCWMGSVTDELPEDYDLITCIEVLEHVNPKDAASAVANFCRHGRAVLFSSTPEHFAEVTHINVHPPDYWADLFARHGFYRNFDFDASFVAPHAVLFHPVAHWQQVVRGYERWNWDTQRELQGIRMHRDRLHSEAEDARNELHALLRTKTFRLTARARAAWARVRANRR
jgi:2-polyprenyl-3-methyl-5-hydroxy-6-metoxy-1,4-benzoquinol methylase